MDKEVIMYLEAQKMAVRVALRDHFAGLAMQGMLANHEMTTMTDERVARMAYEMAAAMLRAREAS